MASISMAFLGARLDINPKTYKMLLGGFLLIASLRFLVLKPKAFEVAQMPTWWVLSIVGAVLGYVSGMLGIGGGVILSPIMLMFHWAKMKEVTAIVAAFIFLNSASGLIGLYSSGYSASTDVWCLVMVSVGGAMVGSYTSAKKLSTKTIKHILTVVLIWAGFKLMLF